MLITEHTNAYLHADMLHGLQRAFGFELPPVTNADRKRRNILGPTTVAWVRIRPLVQHPLTEGVAVAGITTGGVVQGSGWTGVMGGSEHSWMDWGDPGSDSSGFAGNLQREPDEPLGPHAVVAVKEHGEGRVVVLADQNAFGATHIGYEDNERLWSNAVAWALDRPMPLPADNPVTTLTGRRSLCTSAAAFGFHTLQVQSSRLSAWSGTPNRCTAGPDMGDRVLMLPEYAGELPQPARGLALVEPGRLASLRILEPLGLTWSPPGEPSTGAVQWSEPMPAPAGLGLEGTVTAAPLGLTGDFEVVATDAAGRPLVVRSGAWLLLLDAAVLSNAQMGKERASRDEAPGPYDLAFRLLGWLFE